MLFCTDPSPMLILYHSMHHFQKIKKQIKYTLSELQSEKKPDVLENIGISKGNAVVDAAVFIPSLNN